MGMFDDVEGIVKRQMVLFFVVDTSGSMQGTKIGAVNTAIREVIPEIRSISSSNASVYSDSCTAVSPFRLFSAASYPSRSARVFSMASRALLSTLA